MEKFYCLLSVRCHARETTYFSALGSPRKIPGSSPEDLDYCLLVPHDHLQIVYPAYNT